MKNGMKTPELCRYCHWYLSGCIQSEKPIACEYYEPQSLDEDYGEQESEYDAGDDADVWGQNGFEEFQSAWEMTQYFKGV